MAKKYYVNLGYACNCSCIMCVLPDFGNFFFSTEEVKEMIGEWDLTSQDCIEFAGGEPTLHHDFLELCRHAVGSSPAQLWILSNGIRFADRSLSEAFAKVGAAGVMVPLYSHQAETHDRIVQRKGSYAKTVQGLEHLQSLGVTIVIKFIPMSFNYEDPSGYMEFLVRRFRDQNALFSGLCLMGDAKKRIGEVGIRYTRVRDGLESAMNTAKQAGMNACLHLMPMCVFQPGSWKYFGTDFCRQQKVASYWKLLKECPEETSLGQPPVCATCDLRFRCHWVWEEYEKTYGLEEIRPQRNLQEEHIHGGT